MVAQEDRVCRVGKEEQFRGLTRCMADRERILQEKEKRDVEGRICLHSTRIVLPTRRVEAANVLSHNSK